MPFEPAPKVSDVSTGQQQRGRIALAAIAAHVLTIPVKQFDMRNWREEEMYKPLLFPLVAPKCRTIGCAIGHSYRLPEVRATGLHSGVDGAPALDEKGGFDAIALAFGIPREWALQLFLAERYIGAPITRGRVAFRIRDYLAQSA